MTMCLPLMEQQRELISSSSSIALLYPFVITTTSLFSLFSNDSTSKRYYCPSSFLLKGNFLIPLSSFSFCIPDILCIMLKNLCCHNGITARHAPGRNVIHAFLQLFGYFPVPVIWYSLRSETSTKSALE